MSGNEKVRDGWCCQTCADLASESLPKWLLLLEIDSEPSS